MNETVQTDDLEAEPTEELEDVVEEVEAEEVTEETTEDEPKPQSRNQNAKQRLKRKLEVERTENARIRQENEELKDRFGALEKKVDGVINPPPPRPNRVDFDTEEEYEDTLFEWRDQTKVEAKETPPPAPDTRLPALAPEVQKNWDKQMDQGVEAHDDFTDVIQSIKPEDMTDMMAMAIFESDQGGEVGYFLGNNPGEATRISQLSRAKQIREIDKLSNRFKPSTSTAPDPIKPTKGDVTASKSLEDMSPEDYRAERRRQRAAR